MKVGIIGAGRIGGGIARQLARAGHDVTVSFSQYGTPQPPEGQTAAQFNSLRMAGSRYTKSFNTLTAAFQAEAATRKGDDKVVQWICGDDAGAKALVSALVEDAGFVPVDFGPTATCAPMEAPQRDGAVYGEEYRARDAAAVVDAVRSGRPIPPTPVYS